MTVTLLPHQREAVNNLGNGKVLVGGVGTGKTVTALVYFFEKVMGGTVGDFGSVKTPMDIYVFTTARKRDELDWQIWAARLGINRERNASVAGIQLVVDSYNNIGKYTHIHGQFFILDEQRMVGSGSWTKAFLHMAKSNHWIMLSATPGDVWEDYIPLFIANGFYKNRTQFKREHIVYNTFSKFPKVDYYVGVGKLLKLRRRILVEMPYARHTTRHIKEVEVNYNKELFERVVKKRWHVYENRPLRDVSELFSVMRKVVNSDISRLATVSELMKTHPRLIVFYNFDYELELLRTLSQKNLETVPKLERSQISSIEPIIDTSRENLAQTQTLVDTMSLEPKLPQISKSLSSVSAVRQNFPPKSELERTTYSTTTTKSGFTFPNPNQNSKLISNQHQTKMMKSPWVGDIDKDFVEVAEWNGHRHEPLPTSERWVYLVQYVAGAEAWNCTSTNAVVFYSLTYSYKIFEQAMGRIDRLDTPFLNLFYYILLSKSAIDRGISRALKSKQSFNEKNFGVNT
jgi:hypothetical protein